MSKLVRVDGGLVVEIIPLLPDGFSIGDVYHPTILAQITEAPDEVEYGWSHDGDTFVAPPTPSLADLKAIRTALVDAKRDTAFSGGYQHNFGGSAGVRTLDNRNERDAINWLGLKGLVDAKIANGDGADLVQLRDAANDTFDASAATVATALVGMAAWRAAVLSASWSLKDAITAAEDDAALDAIDIDAGWPE